MIAEQIILENCDLNTKCVTAVHYHNISSPSEKIVLPAGAVIITSGGSAFDQSDEGLLAEFAPQLRGMATSSGPQADGSGIKLARSVFFFNFFFSLIFNIILDWCSTC